MNIGNGLLFAQLNAPTQAAAPADETKTPAPAQDWLDTAIHWVADHTSTEWILEKVKTFGPNLISAIAIFVCTIAVARSQREARRAAIEAQQLGQYTLEQRQTDWAEATAQTQRDLGHSYQVTYIETGP